MNFMCKCSHIVCMFLCIQIRIYFGICVYVCVYVDKCIIWTHFFLYYQEYISNTPANKLCQCRPVDWFPFFVSRTKDLGQGNQN